MKAKMVSRFGLALLAVGLVVSLGSSQLYAAPVLGPGEYSIVAAPKPDNPSDKGNNGNQADKGSNGNQGGKANGQSNGNGGDKGNAGGSSVGSGNSNAGGNGGNPNASSEVKPPYPSDGPGANKSGPYNVNPDKIGDPSANGNGNGQDNGKATGKPGMGTVGNADNKNPPGQVKNYPNGNGYECGGNNGVAKGNPAHTPQDCQAGGGTVNPPINPPGDDKGNGGDDKGKGGNGDQNGGGNGGNGGTTPPGQEDKGTPPGQDKGTTPGQDTVGTPAQDSNNSGDNSQDGTERAANPSTSDGSDSEPQLTDESGQLGRSSAGALRAGVLGAPASIALEDLEGQGNGLSGNSPANAPLGMGAAAAAPGTLPYTGEADEVSQTPALWAIGGLMLMLAGMLFRRMALAVVER